MTHSSGQYAAESWLVVSTSIMCWVALALNVELAIEKPIGVRALIPIGLAAGAASAAARRPVLALPTLWACALQPETTTESLLKMASAATGFTLATATRVFSCPCVRTNLVVTTA